MQVKLAQLAAAQGWSVRQLEKICRQQLEKKDELAEKYLKLFCEKTGIAKQLVQKALPIVAASQTTKAVPEEQAFLEKWVNVVDYE